MFLVLPSAVVELLSFHRTEPNEFTDFFQLQFEQIIASSQYIINMETDHASQRACIRVQRKKVETHSLLLNPISTSTLEIFSHVLRARCIIQSKNSFQDEQQAARLDNWESGAVLWWPTACTSAVSSVHFLVPYGH